MAFCGRCGNPVAEGTLCSNCGTPSRGGAPGSVPTGAAPDPGGIAGFGTATDGAAGGRAPSGTRAGQSNLLTYLALGIACIALVVSLFALISPSDNSGNNDFGPPTISKFSSVGSAVAGS